MNLPVLSSDCGSCFGLCCVLLSFSREAGFGVSKAGGTACHHLDASDGCGIHATLREDGWPGCTVFECFGAGQQVSQVTYAGVSWREHDNLGEMAAVLSVMRQLHEMLFLLSEVERHLPGAAGALVDRVNALTSHPPEQLLGLNLDELRDEVGELLATTSARLRSGWTGLDLARADLAGQDLRELDVRGATLRGAVLIAAHLGGLDLTLTDLLGADLRDADVRGARLSDALFLTQPQVNAMRGDTTTELPLVLRRPGHWA
ncbi:pentapeptide repeat-containing protein [Nocardioides sp.]|uniref:pentapeptide repeat-containing protein n=1 Tax=Nocardioides sp. TaxID=35761 RepID=UPI002C67FE9D|nr:pentapeptide repeat-containing protein [Nocardioides sp.]HXH77418.1 pentapeptide repeat-containing protein [Nocardioides sp.]